MQANKMNKLLTKLEEDTQVKFRVLCQRYPQVRNGWMRAAL